MSHGSLRQLSSGLMANEERGDQLGALPRSVPQNTASIRGRRGKSPRLGPTTSGGAPPTFLLDADWALREASASSIERKHAVAPGGGAEHAMAGSIGVVGVIAITFFNVSGGPWGSEDIFSTVGPMMGTAGLLLFAVFFSLPQCLATAELTCAFPSNGGYSVWVRESFGDFWGVQECYWGFVSGVLDSAVYPVLICDTLLQLAGHTDAGVYEVWLYRMTVALLLSLPTFVSVHTVPALLTAFAITTGVPVMAFIAVGARSMSPKVWLQKTDGPVQFGKFINVCFWNMEGFDSISSCTTLIKEPKERTITRGLLAALLIVTVQYTLVLLVAAAYGPDVARMPWQEWNDGSLPSIGCAMGSCMGGFLLLASLVGNAGQYLSEFIEDSYMLQGAADVGLVPRIFSSRMPNSGAPWVANVFQILLVSVITLFDFSDILVFDNCFTAMQVILEFCAFFWLRYSEPDLPRPYRVPWPFVGLFFSALFLLVVVLYHSFSKSWNVALVNTCAFAVGVPYGLWVQRKSKEAEKRGGRSCLDELLEED